MAVGFKLQYYTFVDTILEKLDACDGLLSATKVARILGLHRQTIYDQASSGKLPYVRIGTAVRFDPAIIARWLQQRGAIR
jgi:excisionase family DNA binding protein